MHRQQPKASSQGGDYIRKKSLRGPLKDVQERRSIQGGANRPRFWRNKYSSIGCI